MSDDMDIREWAARNNVDVNARGPIPKAVRERYAADAGDDPGDPGALDDVLDPVAGLEMPPSTETMPVRPAAVSDKAPAWMGSRRTKPAAPATKRPARKRVSIENVVSGAWGIASMFLGRHERALPVARMLNMQAPVAGLIVEDIAKDTIVDRVLQPFARAGKHGEQVAALIGPPMLVAAITANPALYPVLAPVLRMTLMSWMEISAPVMKKARERAEKLAGEFGGADIDAMIALLFAPPAESDEAAAAGGTAAGMS